MEQQGCCIYYGEVGLSDAGDITSGCTWASSDESVATVTSAGLVEAVGIGSATITASKDDGSGSNFITGSINIIVDYTTSKETDDDSGCFIRATTGAANSIGSFLIFAFSSGAAIFIGRKKYKI